MSRETEDCMHAVIAACCLLKGLDKSMIYFREDESLLSDVDETLDDRRNGGEVTRLVATLRLEPPGSIVFLDILALRSASLR